MLRDRAGGVLDIQTLKLLGFEYEELGEIKGEPDTTTETSRVDLFGVSAFVSFGFVN